MLYLSTIGCLGSSSSSKVQVRPRLRLCSKGIRNNNRNIGSTCLSIRSNMPNNSNHKPKPRRFPTTSNPPPQTTEQTPVSSNRTKQPSLLRISQQLAEGPSICRHQIRRIHHRTRRRLLLPCRRQRGLERMMVIRTILSHRGRRLSWGSHSLC